MYENLPQHLHPVLKDADEQIALGHSVFFKFSCLKCNNRCTFEEKNTLYRKGRCEECQHVSDLHDPKVNLGILLVAGFPDGEGAMEYLEKLSRKLQK